MKKAYTEHTVKYHGLPRKRLAFMVMSLVTAMTVRAETPGLVVGIVIDGLRQETLDMLRPYMSNDGFNRLMDGGVVIENLDFGTNLDVPSATALLMTGASPNVNGIGNELVYEPNANRSNSVFFDNDFSGIYTDSHVSPQVLRVTTISDEARIAGAGVTYVYAIAPTEAQALVMGSHAGNSAVWFNSKTGNWATSSFYRELPQPAMNVNRTHSLISRMDTMQWVPSAVTAGAAHLPDHLTRYPFRYTFTGKDNGRFEKFANSPMINNEIVSLASQYVKSLQLGQHDGIDVLNLGFALQPAEFTKTAENRYEMYDSYIKLDAALAEFFKNLDSTLGEDNVIVYISGTPNLPQRRIDDGKWNIPGGEFSSRKAVSLLNLYLVAVHGNGEWVKGFHNGHVYLNADLANTKDLDIRDLRREAAQFLVRMSGVGHAYTIDDIITAQPIVPNALGQSRNTVIEQAGDVVVDIAPGWTLVDDYNYVVPEKEPRAYAVNPTTAPFLLKAPGVASQRIDLPVDARAIAPAITGLMHIRSPNGASTPPPMFKKSDNAR